MLKENSREKRNFKALIETDGIGRVEDRLNVIDVFLNTEDHITLDDFMSLLNGKGYNYDQEFVKLCLNRWVELGFAQKEVFEGQPPRYEHRHLGKHHDHLICTKCGMIIEFQSDEMEQLQERIAAKAGFYILQHKMEIYGLCSRCAAARSDLMPLTSTKTGEEVYIRDVVGGGNAKSRLISMGFSPGDRLEIINNDGEGRLIVGRGDSRLALGRGMAENIIVSPDRQGMERGLKGHPRRRRRLWGLF
ncbi:MAG: transcriptional repressor [Deltaproteobacteria bacterium]|nr:transcriptional repressor [Deltaproteobacteria bacterium]